MTLQTSRPLGETIPRTLDFTKRPLPASHQPPAPPWPQLESAHFPRHGRRANSGRWSTVARAQRRPPPPGPSPGVAGGTPRRKSRAELRSRLERSAWAGDHRHRGLDITHHHHLDQQLRQEQHHPPAPPPPGNVPHQKEVTHNPRTSPRTERRGLKRPYSDANAPIHDIAPARGAPPPRPRPICVGL